MVAFGSCCPALELTQVPSLPVTAHDWHVPRQVLLQQMPSTQKPLPQSLFPFGQACPFGFLSVEHVPDPLQYFIGPSHVMVALWSCCPTGITEQLPSAPGLLHW